MIWKPLVDIAQWERIIGDSEFSPQLIFKHSTRCIISRTVLRNFESEWNNEDSEVSIYLLDLLSHRDISNAIAAKTGIHHESPQLIILHQGKGAYHITHNRISAKEAKNFLSSI